MDAHKKISHRLKIARGQLDTVLRMVEEKKYCIDVIHQSQAVQSALKEVDNILLENHLHTCVVSFIKKGKTASSMEEVMRLFKNGRK